MQFGERAYFNKLLEFMDEYVLKQNDFFFRKIVDTCDGVNVHGITFMCIFDDGEDVLEQFEGASNFSSDELDGCTRVFASFYGVADLLLLREHIENRRYCVAEGIIAVIDSVLEEHTALPLPPNKQLLASPPMRLN